MSALRLNKCPFLPTWPQGYVVTDSEVMAYLVDTSKAHRFRDKCKFYRAKKDKVVVEIPKYDLEAEAAIRLKQKEDMAKCLENVDGS